MFLHYLSIISKNEVLESIGAFAFAGLLQLTNMWVYMQPQKSRGKLSRGIILAGRWRQDVSKNKCEWTACVYVSPPQLHLWEHGVGEYRGVRFLWSPWTHRDVSITGRIMAAAKASNCESFILNEYVTKSVFFQDHNKVKTPATHPSRRIQEHRETPGSVSAQRERRRRRRRRQRGGILSSSICVCQTDCESKMGHGWQAYFWRGPPHDQRHDFLMSSDPLEEKSSVTLHLWKKLTITSAMLNLATAKR